MKVTILLLLFFLSCQNTASVTEANNKPKEDCERNLLLSIAAFGDYQNKLAKGETGVIEPTPGLPQYALYQACEKRK